MRVWARLMPGALKSAMTALARRCYACSAGAVVMMGDEAAAGG